MKPVTKNIIAFVIFILIAFLGYCRELIFLTINAVLSKAPFPYSTSYVKPPIFLYSYNSSSLLKLKWGLTLAFSILFCFSTYALIKFYFRDKKANKLVLVTYGFFFFISLLIAVIGILFNIFNDLYPISRFISGLLQSPLSSIILFILFYFKATVLNKNNSI